MLLLLVQQTFHGRATLGVTEDPPDDVGVRQCRALDGLEGDQAVVHAAHPDHLCRHCGGCDQVATGTSRDVGYEQFFGDHATQCDPDQVEHLGPRSGEDLVPVAVCQQSQRVTALDDGEDLEAPLGCEQPGRGGVPG